MNRTKDNTNRSDISRRKFLKRSSVALLPYAAPAIASMLVYPADAEAQRGGFMMGRSRRLMMRMQMMGLF